VKLDDIDLDRLLKRLHLANARRIWRDLIVRAEAEQWSLHRFLATLVVEEIAQRTQTRLGRLSTRAQFPFLKTIEEFDFTYQSSVRLSLLGSALSADFVTEGRSLVFLGKPGRGKTHLAVAIAYRAIQNGFEALFVTAAELIDELSAAFRKGHLAEALARFTHPHVLVVDEVGYLTYGTDAANMLFHVVNDRHKRRRSMIFTTNKPLAAWGGVLHDEDLAQAIVDRLLERGRLLHLDGPSMRTRHLGLDAAAVVEAPSDQVVRISGNYGPELPEPTPAISESTTRPKRGSSSNSRSLPITNAWVTCSASNSTSSQLMCARGRPGAANVPGRAATAIRP
jgi:DNA replication protein DnaC